MENKILEDVLFRFVLSSSFSLFRSCESWLCLFLGEKNYSSIRSVSLLFDSYGPLLIRAASVAFGWVPHAQTSALLGNGPFASTFVHYAEHHLIFTQHERKQILIREFVWLSCRKRGLNTTI